ncbi:MAG TPA: efflux transporter outer membrane subunit [Caulobacteraceae bacterium]
MLSSPLKTASLLAALGLAGCLVGPNYVRPSAPMSAAYKEARGWAPAQPSDAADRRDWWRVFGDPVLDDLEARVTVSNQNLAAAEAAYRQARALTAQQRAALFPTVSLTASVNVTGGGGGRGTVTTYQPGVGASWAPDIWGAVRRGIENAGDTAQASAADLANARLSAQMELAADYIALRQFDEEKRLLDTTIAAYQRSLAINQNKYRAGVSARSDVFSAQSQLDSTKAQDVDLIQQRARVEHAIAILTGAPPAQLDLPAASWNLRLPEIPSALPSTLLQRRPDIAANERLAAAANAQIGVATAAYYPSVNLTGQAGFAANELSGIFSASNFVWSLGASAAETIFDAGARRARVAAARAAYDQAVANYRQTVLTAFGQVEDNLAAQRVLGSEESLRASASSAADASERIARNQYRAGQADYTTVIVAQATALGDRTALLQVQAARLTTAVDLIAALGGGWTAAELPARP